MSEPLTRLMRIIGPAALARVRAELAGERLHIPAARTNTAARRRAAVAQMLAQGTSCPVIASRLGCSLRTVQRIAAMPNRTARDEVAS